MIVVHNCCLRYSLNIPLSDLKYSVEYDRGDSGELLGSWYNLDPQSVQSAISVRFSDIKVISIGDIPSLTFPEHIEAQSE